MNENDKPQPYGSDQDDQYRTGKKPKDQYKGGAKPREVTEQYQSGTKPIEVDDQYQAGTKPRGAEDLYQTETKPKDVNEKLDLLLSRVGSFDAAVTYGPNTVALALQTVLADLNTIKEEILKQGPKGHGLEKAVRKWIKSARGVYVDKSYSEQLARIARVSTDESVRTKARKLLNDLNTEESEYRKTEKRMDDDDIGQDELNTLFKRLKDLHELNATNVEAFLNPPLTGR